MRISWFREGRNLLTFNVPSVKIIDKENGTNMDGQGTRRNDNVWSSENETEMCVKLRKTRITFAVIVFKRAARFTSRERLT